MVLGTALIVGGLWWALDVSRRPGHVSRDFRGPAIMTGIGVLTLLLYSIFLAKL